ncbi:MAG: hypothetical protein HYV35_06180 [Lentisphaerae bacterium]|nr:hypothetical protein [Lentisphaerota bacterium]
MLWLLKILFTLVLLVPLSGCAPDLSQKAPRAPASASTISAEGGSAYGGNHQPSTITQKVPPDQAAELRTLTTEKIRAVWCQDIGDGADAGAEGVHLRLMGYDSEDGRGERAILAKPANYAKPLLTPRGERIVFSNPREQKIYVVNFDGSGLRAFSDGFALAVWEDPLNGNEWVYAGTAVSNSTALEHIRRQLLNQASVSEPVWDRTLLDIDNFQLSADGRRASGSYPWPACGLLELPNGAAEKFGDGCWPSLAPDNSYLLWFFDGAHRNLTLCATTNGRRWVIHLAQAPGIEGFEVYHPRWSSHPRFMAMTGPYKEGEGDNRIRGGGAGVEIHLGRFSPDFQNIEQWVQLTHNTNADFSPDVWIARPQRWSVATAGAAGSRSVSARPSEPAPAVADKATSASWPGRTDNLVFLWENRSKNNEVFDPESGQKRICRTEPHGLARYGRFLEMDTEGGAFVAESGADELLAGCLKSYQFGIEALVTATRTSQSGPTRSGLSINHQPSTINHHSEGPARIIACSSGPDSFNFILGQEQDRLVFRLRTATNQVAAHDPVFDLGAITADKPCHVIVSYRPGELSAYMDGKQVLLAKSIEAGHWGPQHLIFGDEWTGGINWAGKLEGVALYTRWIDPQEARRKFELYAERLPGRKPATRLALMARPVELARIPTLAAIAPYRRALVVNRYDVEKVAQGRYAEAQVMVAHWAILDGQVLPDATRDKNQTYQLILEPFDEHPELEGERLIMESDEFRLSLYYQVR